MRSCAGIVTYNPEIIRLKENISSIVHQLEFVYIVDNGSNNIDEIEQLCNQYESIQLFSNGGNRGIATALNQIFQIAVKDGFTHVLTLDQDSVSTYGMVDALEKLVAGNVGIVSPQIIDRNREGVGDVESQKDRKIYTVKQAARKGILTSGSLTSIEAWKKVGGFDESLFIDYVDYDFNKRLLLEGYTLFRTGEAALIHECGNLQPTWLYVPRKEQDGTWRFERFYSFGHSAFRCYYKARNRIIYTKKYIGSPGFFQFEGAIQIIPQIVLTLLFEHEKKQKLSAFFRGIKDGVHTKVERYEISKKRA